MTVKKLIEELKKLNQDDEVTVWGTVWDDGEGTISTESGDIEISAIKESK